MSRIGVERKVYQYPEDLTHTNSLNLVSSIYYRNLNNNFQKVKNQYFSYNIYFPNIVIPDKMHKALDYIMYNLAGIDKKTPDDIETLLYIAIWCMSMQMDEKSNYFCKIIREILNYKDTKKTQEIIKELNNYLELVKNNKIDYQKDILEKCYTCIKLVGQIPMDCTCS